MRGALSGVTARAEGTHASASSSASANTASPTTAAAGAGLSPISTASPSSASAARPSGKGVEKGAAGPPLALAALEAGLVGVKSGGGVGGRPGDFGAAAQPPKAAPGSGP